MSLEQLGEEVQAFVKESQELTTGYKETLQNEVNEGQRSIRVNLSAKSDKIREKIMPVREAELKKIAESNEPGATMDTPEVRTQQLGAILGRMDKYLSLFKNPDFNECEAEARKNAKEAIDIINYDITGYHKL